MGRKPEDQAGNLWELYGQMFLSRTFEEITTRFWMVGLISGEMHLGIGEEAIAAGVVSHMTDGDALAIHHRPTPFLLMRGVNPAALLAEFLGLEQGLCRGQGGHMHLYSKEHWAASSGIIGASGPCGSGFALACQHLRPGAAAVSVFGESSLNQGMLMESMNLAVVWNLPQVFVCPDDGWAITTPSGSQRGASLCDRVRGFGMPAEHVDGLDAESVWHAAGRAFERARSGSGPTFLHAMCSHPQGHFLGDLLLDAGRNPVRQLPQYVLPLMKSALSPGGAPIQERIRGLAALIGRIRDNALDRSAPNQDPVARLRAILSKEEERLRTLEIQVRTQMVGTLQSVFQMGNEEGHDAYADV